MSSRERRRSRALRLTALLVGVAGILSLPGSLFAAEGGADLYVPGLYGDFGMATPPAGGWYLSSVLTYSDVGVGVSVRQGLVSAGIRARTSQLAFALSYVFDVELLGGRYLIAISPAVANVNYRARVTVGEMEIARRADGFDRGDLSFTPLGLSWRAGEVGILFTQNVSVPTGYYDVDDAASLGLDYWAFETNLAATWLDARERWELSANLGYVYNLESRSTNYRSGNSLHLDVTLGFHTDRWSVGLVGHGYEQITADRGRGALLGDLEGYAYGAGLAVAVSLGERRPVDVVGKWVRDLDSRLRLEGDYLLLSVGFPF